jgi:hypothetical protein
MGNVRLAIAAIVLCWTVTTAEAHQAKYPTVPMQELLNEGYKVVYWRWLRTNLHFLMKKDEDIVVCTYHGDPKEAHKSKGDYQSFAYCDAPTSKLRLWNDRSSNCGYGVGMSEKGQTERPDRSAVCQVTGGKRKRVQTPIADGGLAELYQQQRCRLRCSGWMPVQRVALAK